MEFTNKILNIIENGYESKLWDFKKEWHSNNAVLIHDIICFANNENNEDSYLIFGVEDNGNICGTNNRKKLADIVDLLRNSASFFANNIPEINLTSISFEDKIIDVLIIRNTNKTPYFLNSDYIKQGVRIRYGHIYSRTNDRNTPKDNQADPIIIEKFCRKRFGIDLTIQEKLDHLLLEINSWKSFNGNEPYKSLSNYENVVHDFFPEFRLEAMSDITFDSYTTEGFCKFYPDPNVSRFPINIYFNSTKIK